MATTVKDPVCGMDVDPQIARYTSEFAGQTYFFCARGCKTEFDADPEKYVKPREKGSA